MNANTVNKIKIVADIVAQNYEAGRQDRSLKWCYQNIVNKLYPMSERTFWRYMQYATEKLNYTFTEKDELYLDDVFSKMKPETLEKVKNVANLVVKVKPQGKTRTNVYNQLVEQKGMELNNSNFSKYVRIAETYLGYNFNFQ